LLDEVWEYNQDLTHGAMSLQVDEDRPVAMPPAEGEIVHAQNPRRRGGELVTVPQDAEQGVRAHR
jgi:hypothetical protein